MLTLVLAVLTAVQSLVAQVPQPIATPFVLNNGACLDSMKSVPQGLFGSDPSSAIMRIDKVIAHSTMIDGEIIGYLYTREDGTTWLGQRAQRYMSAADSEAINTVLGSAHLPDAKVTQFPPVRVYGVRTNYTEIFRVKLPPAAMDALRISLEPCVAWPAGMTLPNPLP
jgi:hypothetical protein